MKPISHIRSLGLSKVNHLVKAAARYQELQPAFADWAAGEVYVCKKTGDYRYRFGEQSKGLASWNKVAREIFAGPEELAFAAMVLVKPVAPDRTKLHQGDANMHKAGAKLHKMHKAEPTSARANIIALAGASQEAA